MFVLKNAWSSVVRNAGRNILIVVIVAVIAAAATVGLAIRNAAQNARETGLSSTTVTATIDMDRDKMMSAAQSSQSSSSDGKPDKDAMRKALDQSSLTLAEYRKYAKASSVPVTTYYTQTTSVNATDGFQPVETSTSNREKNSSASHSAAQGASDSHGGEGMPGGLGGGFGGLTPSSTRCASWARTRASTGATIC